MRVAIMQPYFLPYIGYFKLISQVDTFVVYDDVNFIKRGWINRNNILVNEKAFLFTVPLKLASQNKLINEIEIDINSIWKDSLLKTIQLSYAKAPFFEEVYPIIEEIVGFKEKNISKFIIYSLKRICDFLDIKTNILISSEIRKNNDLKGQEKIIEICQKLGATEYLNASGGKDLYEQNEFLNKNICLKFIGSSSITYSQFKNTFIPYLSIIDVMMFNSSKSIVEFLNSDNL
ncbi:WbqC family protein [Flavobacterium sp. 17A]|uniref:WbqC family protein n=1 Tax=Flavobacterium potami TaxID=2872310 RepID=A0A9X1HC36_9FLAO|nr:WbqC family protein [Flavobacterium potami]MBZ4036558.1 WbqC family protein [Flavobacterium potami]